MIPTQKKSSEVGADGSPLNTEGQKRAIADQSGTSNPPTIGRSSQQKGDHYEGIYTDDRFAMVEY